MSEFETYLRQPAVAARVCGDISLPGEARQSPSSASTPWSGRGVGIRVHGGGSSRCGAALTIDSRMRGRQQLELDERGEAAVAGVLIYLSDCFLLSFSQNGISRIRMQHLLELVSTFYFTYWLSNRSSNLAKTRPQCMGGFTRIGVVFLPIHLKVI
jgi:hypothetical protein